MPDPNEAVTEEASTPSTQTQETPSETQPAEGQTAPSSQATEETTVQETPIAQQEQGAPAFDLDERGVPWKNRAMESERKLHELPQVIRQTVAEELSRNQKPAQPEYTIEQLEQYAIENPQYRAWTEARKAEIIQKNLEKTLDARMQATETKVREEGIRKSAESWVVSHPEFQSCFISDASGNKTWNHSNPLTQIIGQILNTVDPTTGKLVRDRADGLAVAAEMAYGRYMLSSKTKNATQVTQLKKDLRKAQKTQMIPGKGAVPSQPARSTVQKAIDTYNKSYNKEDLKVGVRAILAAQGILKEE